MCSRSIRLEAQPRIIFVTAHAQHALNAFAVAAVDHLLKPVQPERLAESLARVGPPRRAITLRTPSRVVILAPGELAALCAEGDLTRIHLAEQASLLIPRTLAQFGGTLPRPLFARLGRPMIQDLERVRHVTSRWRDQNQVVLEWLGSPCPFAGFRRCACARRLPRWYDLREGLVSEGEAAGYRVTWPTDARDCTASNCERKTCPLKCSKKSERLSASITGPFTSER